ncbi:MAG TPA: transglutaminase domain-containing protein, partial [Agromyces sp.]|nr:transglutaminase domain-containing protein [Agromyces sp.]
MTGPADPRRLAPGTTARMLRTRPRGLRGQSALSVGVTVTMVAGMHLAAMIPWWPTYESGAFVVAALVAVAAGAAVGLLGAAYLWPSWAVACGIAAAFLVLGVPVAVPSRAHAGVLPTAEGLVELVAATALSWKQLVTISVPVG